MKGKQSGTCCGVCVGKHVCCQATARREGLPEVLQPPMSCTPKDCLAFYSGQYTPDTALDANECSWPAASLIFLWLALHKTQQHMAHLLMGVKDHSRSGGCGVRQPSRARADQHHHAVRFTTPPCLGRNWAEAAHGVHQQRRVQLRLFLAAVHGCEHERGRQYLHLIHCLPPQATCSKSKSALSLPVDSRRCAVPFLGQRCRAGTTPPAAAPRRLPPPAPLAPPASALQRQPHAHAVRMHRCVLERRPFQQRPDTPSAVRLTVALTRCSG